MDELREILEKFARSGWSVIAAPARDWLSGNKERLVAALRRADAECGNCGCEFDPLYKRALKLLEQ
jgi:hypothetical protein